MFKKILVPLDGSELAEVALIYAKELAIRLDLEVILFHVCVPEEQQLAPMHRSYLERMCETIGQQSENDRDEIGNPSKHGSVQGRCELAMGHPAEEILHYAQNNGVDLIMMTTHGRSGIRRWAMGSVADKVLRASKVPIWLVRTEIPKETIYDTWPCRRLLVPLDGSVLAESVLQHVESLAKQRGTGEVEVILVRVSETPFITTDYPEASMRMTWEEHVEYIKSLYREVCEKYLSGVEKRLNDAGLKVRSEVLMGEPAEAIIGYANKNPFNLIAMSTHGRSGIGRWIYGGVADKVLHGVTSPIFLVRPL